MRVLVVDDDRRVHALVKRMADARGYRIVSAFDGEEGLGAATKSPPDLILVDVMMPRIDGWSLVRRLRARVELASVPILFISALSGTEDRLRGFRLGADAFLTKPFRLDELSARIDAAMRGRKEIEREQRKLAAMRAAPRGQRPAVLDGALADFGLPVLFFMLEQAKKTGVMRLSRTDAAGEIQLRDGRIVGARLGGRQVPEAARRNQAAIYHMLGWSEGWFAFSVEEVSGDIDVSANELLLEGARLLDEAKRH
jgi:CheY-like chemotaxis protein